jgi:hypothetical protein
MTKTGCVKVGGLSNKRVKQSDPRLGWIMFHNICKMYRNVKEATTKYYDEVIMNNVTKNSIKAKIFGNQDGVDKEYDIPAVELHHTHDKDATDVTSIDHGCMKEIHEVEVLGITYEDTVIDAEFEESAEVVDDNVNAISAHRSIPVLGEVTAKESCSLAVGTARLTDSASMKPIIVPVRSESPNELLGHRDNSRIIM